MICRTCGNSHQENFCPHCGEKKYDKHNLSVKHFLEETFESLIHFDNKFFRSVKMLIGKPGQLTREYVEGRRVRYMKPAQLFVVINLLFFFLVFNNPYSLPLQKYLSFQPFTNYHTKEIVDKKLQRTGMALPEYEALFDEKMKSESKEFIFLFVPFYALVFGLFFFWQKRQFVEYLTFATHFYAFILIYFFILVDGILLPYHYITGINYSEDIEVVLNYLTQVALFVYLFFAIRKFFSPPLILTLITAALVGYFFFYFIQYYRMLLFYKIVSL